MAEKKLKALVKVQLQAGKATPAPPVGPALGQHGVNIQEFCTKFNAETKDMGENIIPAEISIFEDRTFIFKLKTPPASTLIIKAAGIKKGSSDALKTKVGKITRQQAKEIAEKKMPDLNANDIEAAMKIIEGTARNMGVSIEG